MATMSPPMFGALLRRHRLAAGLTQEALAELAGVSTRGLQHLERDRTTPRAETVRLLADALGLDETARATLIAAVHPELAAPSPPFPGPVAATSSIPTPPTLLVGREREVAEACALLRRPDVRLLTLIGPGGVGKSRLALAIAAELAADFADGVVWVELAALQDAALVPAALAHALGVREESDRPLTETLAAFVAGRRLLLVLDNMEQVLPAGPLLAVLLAAGPRLAVVVASRARLRLRGERVVVVEPLGVPEEVGADAPIAGLAGVAAVRLFVERAAEVRPGFSLTPENAAAVAAICRRLDGLPLALELAAARITMLSPAMLRDRLGRRLPLLTDGPRDLPARQQTMRDAIAWSHDLLSDAEQACFRRLAVFTGGFALDAAERVTDVGFRVTGTDWDAKPAASDSRHPTPDTFDLLAGLCDQSLLRSLGPPSGEPRFAPLETVREYAWERLVASGESDTARRAHATFYAAFVERAEPELTGPAHTEWLDRLEADHDNLRAALAWAIAHDPAMALRLTGALWRFWYIRGYLGEGRSWLEQALAQEGGTAAERAKALHAAGDLAQEQGDYAQAAPLLEAGFSAARASGQQTTAALCLSGLGFIARNQGNYEESTALHEKALDLQRALGDRRAIACSLANLGSIAQHRREEAQAEALFAESLATFHDLGDRPLAADVGVNLAILANQGGDHSRASRLAEDALATYRELGDRQAAATALLALANAVRAQGDMPRAEALYSETLDLFRAVDHKQGMASALNHLARLTLDAGSVERARPLLRESLEILRQTGDTPMIAAALDVASRLAGALEAWEQAARLAGAAAGLRAALGIPAPSAADDAQPTAVVAELGETAFGAAFAAGQVLPPDSALAEALTVVDERGSYVHPANPLGARSHSAAP